MSSEPMKSLNALRAFLETKCACQPDGEDGVVECEPCSWVGAIQLLVAKHARCVEDNVAEQVAHGETLIELEAAASRERELEARVELAEARVAELGRDAKRYRWLFSVDANGPEYYFNGVMSRVNGVYWGYYDGQPENWDAAIDAAMAGEEP